MERHYTCTTCLKVFTDSDIKDATELPSNKRRRQRNIILNGVPHFLQLHTHAKKYLACELCFPNPVVEKLDDQRPQEPLSDSQEEAAVTSPGSGQRDDQSGSVRHPRRLRSEQEDNTTMRQAFQKLFRSQDSSVDEDAWSEDSQARF